MRYIRFPIQAAGKFCWYCHFQHIGKKIPGGRLYRWCDAFAQELETDKKDRPLRIDDCLAGEIHFIDGAGLKFKRRLMDTMKQKERRCLGC